MSGFLRTLREMSARAWRTQVLPTPWVLQNTAQALTAMRSGPAVSGVHADRRD